jgi:hypothetical protein
MTTTAKIIFNTEKQRNHLKELNSDQLFERLKSDFDCIKNKIFCKVRTEESIKKLILITMDILRSREIFIYENINNPTRTTTFSKWNYSERFIRLYSKIDNKMVFDKILMY